MSLSIIIVIALVADRFLQELPNRYHPLVFFGRWADFIENRFNYPLANRYDGSVALFLALFPMILSGYFILTLADLVSSTLQDIIAILIVYVAIGWQSLLQHAQQVIIPLQKKQIEKARVAVSMLVSRDTKELTETEIAKATTESVLENGADAIFAAIFWFCVAGLAGIVIYRLVNTLDAMWGYKNERFYHFGWAAARLDDVLNYIPARLTALSYAVVGNTKTALESWRLQAPQWKSPNAGPVMAAGAGAIETQLGGKAIYHHKEEDRPLLGTSMNHRETSAVDIKNACTLVNKALYLWVGVIIMIDLLW